MNVKKKSRIFTRADGKRRALLASKRRGICWTFSIRRASRAFPSRLTMRLRLCDLRDTTRTVGKKRASELATILTTGTCEYLSILFNLIRFIDLIYLGHDSAVEFRDRLILYT